MRTILSQEPSFCQPFLDKPGRKNLLLCLMRMVRTILAFFWAGTAMLLLGIPLLLITWAFRSPKIIFLCIKPVIRIRLPDRRYQASFCRNRWDPFSRFLRFDRQSPLQSRRTAVVRLSFGKPPGVDQEGNPTYTSGRLADEQRRVHLHRPQKTRDSVPRFLGGGSKDP